MKHCFIIDGMYHRGDVRELRSAVEHEAERYPGAQIEWIVRPDQKPLLSDCDLLAESDDTPDVPDLVRSQVCNSAKNGHAESVFHICSYDVEVLKIASALNGPTVIVVPTHLSNLQKDTYRFDAPATRPVGGPSAASLLSDDEARELVKTVLREGGHTSPGRAMHQSKLRPEMVRRDARAWKDARNPASRSLVADQIARGKRERWLIQEYRGGTGHEYIWLNEAQDGAMAAPAKLPEPDRLHDEPQGRVMQFEAFTRQERIGSPARARPYVFLAIAEILDESGPASLAVLVGRLAERAKELAHGAGCAHPEENWDAVAQCVLNAMLKAKVFLQEDGTPVLAGIGEFASQVARLADDFQQQTEAYMALHIISATGGVSLDDRFYLALTLYRRGQDDPVPRPELLTRVDELLIRLQQQDLIEEKDGKIIALYR